MISKKIDFTTSRLELAAIITDTLNQNNISAVLVGGSVVSIYTNNEYESRDLDFISPADHKKIIQALNLIGYKPVGKDFYHEHSNFTIEFPMGPLGIGDRSPIKPEGKINVGETQIILLSPTQSCMDRLAWFYFNNDRQCLDQAVMLYKHQNIDLAEIQKWSKEEKQEIKFNIFLMRIKDL